METALDMLPPEVLAENTLHPGRQIGTLRLIEVSPMTHRHTLWKCRCFCGKEIVTRAHELKHRKKLHCGCLRRELRRAMKELDE
jgi:hypothetical protein